MPLINYWRKKIRFGPFFGSSLFELHHFKFNIGSSSIGGDVIEISDYPFQPSTCYPNRKLRCSEMDEIHLDQSPLTIKVGKELVFISSEKTEVLKEFARKNNVKTCTRASNWCWITEPFLDCEFNDEHKNQVDHILINNGIPSEEIISLRNEVQGQMNKYNFDTMHWEWCNLDLADVLIAMRPLLSAEEYDTFYWRAMETEQRTNE